MDHQELDWLDRRATTEFQMGQQAPSLHAARPHYAMAVQYLGRAVELKRRLRSSARKEEGVLTEPK